MTLKLGRNIDMLKTYLCTENEVALGPAIQKLQIK